MLYHELENINEAEDSKDELNHIPISSPIALFINTLSGDLKVFAIQWDSHQGNDNIQVKIRNEGKRKNLHITLIQISLLFKEKWLEQFKTPC